MTAKTIIISDIHNDYFTAEKIIKKENPDKIIFLGDYFDDFDDTVKDSENTAKWLVKSLKQENRIHLIGNHDLSYMTDNSNLKCLRKLFWHVHNTIICKLEFMLLES